MVYQRPVPEPSPTSSSGFSSIRRFRSDQSPVLLTSWMAKTFSPLLIRTKQYLPGCKCPANSSMVSHAINIAIFSLNGYNRLRSHRKAKERPGNDQGKAKGRPGHLTAIPCSDLGFSELSGDIGNFSSSCDHMHYFSSVPSAHSPGHPGHFLKHFRGRRRRA